MICSRLLRHFDSWFPPNPAAYISAGDQLTAREIQKAQGSMGGYLAQLPSPDIDVLDFGCGWGGETIWLAERVRSVVGYDVDSSCIEQARHWCAISNVSNCSFEHSSDGRLPFADNSFDAVFSTDTFEHVMDLDLSMAEIRRVLRPGGVALSRFGPLFFSPHGYHLYWACQIPYAHLFFGLSGVLELRKLRSGKDLRATNWQALGLNGKRFADYKRAAERAGFEVERFDAKAVRGLKILTRLPVVRDLFIFGIDYRLRKPAWPIANLQQTYGTLRL